MSQRHSVSAFQCSSAWAARKERERVMATLCSIDSGEPFQEDGSWYFWNEEGDRRFGPYDTKDEADHWVTGYCDMLEADSYNEQREAGI